MQIRVGIKTVIAGKRSTHAGKSVLKSIKLHFHEIIEIFCLGLRGLMGEFIFSSVASAPETHTRQVYL